MASLNPTLWKPDCSCLEPVLHRDGFVNQLESGAAATMLEFLDLRLLIWLVQAKKILSTVTGSRTVSCSFNIQTLAGQETNGHKINSE